jgi:hypothetical protein
LNHEVWAAGKKKLYWLLALFIFSLYLTAITGTSGPRVVITADTASGDYLDSLKAGRVDVEPSELVEHRSRQDLRDQRKKEESVQDEYWK